MRILPRILEIKTVESYKITCVWSTGEIRSNDLAIYANGDNERLQRLADVSAFSNVEVADGTLQWPSIELPASFRGNLILQPLSLDPDVLYKESILVGTSTRVLLSFCLKKARIESGLTQNEVAMKSGTTKTYISRIESGKADFQVSTFDRIMQQGLGKQAHIQVI